jgi:uncharacterized membrane protein YphA (DoxX/SURF4 family)
LSVNKNNAPSDPALSEWPLIKKLLFGFFFIFFLLYIFLNPNAIVPYSFYLNRLCIQPYIHLVAWLTKDVLHIVRPSIQFYNGTIDSIFGYLSILFIFLVALTGSLVWMVIDRKSPGHDKLYRILILILRYYLATTWIAYGSMKIIRIQFQSLSPDMLLQTYGNSSPTNLAWAFMGHSAAYNYLIGIAEYAAGLLLFFRRTSVLGNLIGLSLIINVVAFDYSFDVNVKLLATVLMMMTLFLLSKDISRLTDFFFLNKVVYPANDPPIRFKNRWGNRILLVTKYAFIVYIIFFDLRGYVARTKQGPFSTVKQPLYGIYDVTAFIRNRDTLMPLITDATRWKKLAISSPPGNASVMLMNDSLKNFVFKPDTVKKNFVLYVKKDTSDKYAFNYRQRQKGILILRGKWHTDTLEIRLKQYDISRFPLISRKFRWILDHNAGFKN